MTISDNVRIRRVYVLQIALWVLYLEARSETTTPFDFADVPGDLRFQKSSTAISTATTRIREGLSFEILPLTDEIMHVCAYFVLRDQTLWVNMEQFLRKTIYFICNAYASCLNVIINDKFLFPN